MSAESDAALRYDAQQDAVKRRLAAVGAKTAANEVALNTYGEKGAQALTGVYDTLDSQLAHNRADTATQLTNQANSINQGWQDAVTQTNAARDESSQRVRDLAQRLGLEAAQLPVISQIEETANHITRRAREGDAAYTGNLKNWSGQIDSLLGRGQNIGRQQRADAQSRLQQEVLKAIADARLQGTTEETDLYGQLASILGERGNYLVSRQDELAQQQWERDYRQAQLDQAAQQASAELALRAAGMSADNAYKAASLQRAGAQESKDDWFKLLQYDLDNRRAGVSGSQFDRQMELEWAKLLGQDEKQTGSDPLDIARILLGADGGTYDANTALQILQQVGVIPPDPMTASSTPAAIAPALASATKAALPTKEDLFKAAAGKRAISRVDPRLQQEAGGSIPTSINMGGLRFGA